MRKYIRFSLMGLCAMPMLLWSQEGSALPVFARKYHTACTTCHVAFPIRNGFGEAFRNNGYRFPSGQDEDMVKEEPIKLGQESYKKVFPDAIWPSDLPNMPTLGFVGKIRAYAPKDAVPGTSRPQAKIVEDLETFFAGTVTEQITYFGDFAINEGGLEWGKLNLMWSFKPGLNLVLGEVGITEKMVLVSARPGWKRDGYATTMPAIDRGAEIRYASDIGSTGGYSLSAGIGKQHVEGVDLEAYGNLGDSKYVRATYKIGGHGLLSGAGGTHGVEHIGMDNAVTLGVNYFNSTSGSQPNTQEDLAGLTKGAYSFDVEATYGSLRFLGQYARFNEVLNAGIDYGKRTAYSLEGDYWFYPWLIGVLRYEYLKDDLNGTMEKMIPAVAAMLRPNAKVGLEYVGVEHKKGSSAYTAPSSWQLFTQVGF